MRTAAVDRDAPRLEELVAAVAATGCQARSWVVDLSRPSEVDGLMARIEAEAGPVDPLRVAAVAFRYGKDFAGGAETSLRTVCEALQQAGHHVEVFTTCTHAEHDWTNELPPGSSNVDGLRVHRCPIDAHDQLRHREAQRSKGLQVVGIPGPLVAAAE